MNEVIESQKNILGISDFLESAQKYTSKTFPDLNINTIFNNAIRGHMNNSIFENIIGKLVR